MENKLTPDPASKALELKNKADEYNKKMAKIYLDFLMSKIELYAEQGLVFMYSYFDQDLDVSDIQDKIIYEIVVNTLREQGLKVDSIDSALTLRYISQEEIDERKQETGFDIFIAWD